MGDAVALERAGIGVPLGPTVIKSRSLFQRLVGLRSPVATKCRALDHFSKGGSMRLVLALSVLLLVAGCDDDKGPATGSSRAASSAASSDSGRAPAATTPL